jgi:hypothetical protein
MNSADSFSPDYASERAKFRDAARTAGGQVDSHGHPEPGPDGGDLSTDIAWFGPRSAPAVLVMISATHGVEGFCGSGAQVDWLRRGEASRLPRGVAVLMIHAINPFGFAWLRRVTDRRGSAAFARATGWWGAAIACPADGTSTSADITGDSLGALGALLPHAEVTGMALEIGTQSLIEVLTALRADAWLHAHGDLGSPQGLRIKAQVRDAFYGDADDWKGMVAGQSLLATRQAINGLSTQ